MKTDQIRGGSTLVFVIVVVAVVTSLALGAGAMLASRLALNSDAALRDELRREASSAAALAAWMIDGDTNGVDHVREEWAIGFVSGDVEVSVEDEMARIKFQDANEAALAALMVTVSPRDAPLGAEEATGQASAAYSWWNALRILETNRILYAEEELLAAPATAPEALARALPRLSVLGQGKVNVNTAGREVFVALVVGAGGNAETAERLYRRVERSRARGEYFESIGLIDARKLLGGGGGDPVTQEEARVLQMISQQLCVESGLFRITATASRGGAVKVVQCVYERGTGRIMRWLEY